MSRETKRDGNWLDEMGACKVCDGEIPYGHTNECDIFKLEQKVRAAESEVTRWKATVAAMEADSGRIEKLHQLILDGWELTQDHNEPMGPMLAHNQWDGISEKGITVRQLIDRATQEGCEP